jgi:hypothetical protein
VIGRRAVRSVVTVVAAVGLTASSVVACGGAPDGRLDAKASTTTSAEERVTDTSPVTLPPPPNTRVVAPDVPKASAQNDVCVGQAGQFVPSTIPGYALSGNVDVSNVLPVDPSSPVGQGVSSLGGQFVSRSADEAAGAILVIVMDPKFAGIAGATVETLLLGAAGLQAVRKISVDGNLAFTGLTAENQAGYLFQKCDNVWINVVGADAAMALDLTKRILAT